MDDYYTVLRSSQISPEELLLTLNSVNSSIQFTIEYIKNEIPFPNILIKRNENGIWVNLYHKLTNTQRYQPFIFSQLNQKIIFIAENNAEKLRNLELKIKFI